MDNDTTNQPTDSDDSEPSVEVKPTVDLRQLLDVLLAPLRKQLEHNEAMLKELTAARAQAEMTAPMLVLQHCHQNGTDYFARVTP